MMQADRISEIGVVVGDAPSNLKQQILLFDSVAFVDVEAKIENLRAIGRIEEENKSGALANDIEFLASQNLIYSTNSSAESVAEFVESLPFEDTQRQFEIIERLEKALTKMKPAVLRQFKRTQKRFQEGKEINLEKMTDSLNEVLVFRKVKEFYMARILAKKIQFEGFQATTLSDEFDAFFAAEPKAATSDVIQVVLNKIPLPDDNTPWEAVLDFRSDPKTKHYLNGLRLWMSEVTKSNLSKIELEQKLEWLLFQQSEHIRLHRMTSNLGVMGSVFVGGMEMLEDVAKFRLGNIARSLVSLSTRKAELLKSELSSPAKEISYLLRANKAFPSDNRR